MSNLYNDLKNTKTIRQWVEIKRNIKMLSWAVTDTFLQKGDENDHRTVFQHDIGRIIHSKAFRRLKHKTQVFISYEKDHYRTRLTHTMEVFQLATSIARTLGLNEDLTAAISLGHDLGHTPFGHAGESTLDEIMLGACREVNELFGDYAEIRYWGIKKQLNDRKKKLNFGFKHNYHSLRSAKIENLLLSKEVKDGILKHTRWFNIKDKKYRELFDIDKDIDLGRISSLEGQVVDWSDEISQRCHDLDDGVRSGLIKIDDKDLRDLFDKLDNTKKYADKTYVRELIKEYQSSCEKKSQGIEPSVYLPNLIKSMVNMFATNLLECSIENLKEKMSGSEDVKSGSFKEACNSGSKKERYCSYAIQLDSPENATNNMFTIFNFQGDLEDVLIMKVYHGAPSTVREERAAHFIINLFKAYLNNPLALSDKTLKKYYERLNNSDPETKILDFRKEDTRGREITINKMRLDIKLWEIICDHISGMTDDYVQDRFERFYTPFKMVTND